MPAIVERTFSDGTDKALSLDNYQATRKLSIGTDWQQICIGLTLGMYGSGNLTGTPELTIGICNESNGFFATDKQWLGVKSVDATWTEGTVGTDPDDYNYWTVDNGSGISMKWYSRIDASQAYLNQDIGTMYVPNTQYGTAIRRWPIFYEITKGSPNWALYLCQPKNTAFPSTNKTDLLRALETGSRSGIISFFGGSSYLGQHGVYAAAPDEEANGDLNSVAISWNRVSTQLEVFAVAVAKFA